MPSVSVIIPAFNAAATFNETLESIARQTLVDWEAIIVDDGSTDFTASNATVWCNRDSRFKFFKQDNKGLSAARNAGAEKATAPWLLFLDADDLIAPCHLEQLLAVTVESHDTEVVYGGSARIAPDGRIGPRWVSHSDARLFERLSIGNQFAVHECLVRAASFRRAGCFDTTLSTCEDWDLWLRLARTGSKFSEATGGLAFYRMRSSSLSRRVETLFQDGCRVITRSHQRDSRVTEPLPAYETGMPEEHLANALAIFVLWCGGLLVGEKKDPSALLQQAQLPKITEMDIPRAVLAMRGSVPTGACAFDHDWPVLWPKFCGEIRNVFSAVEQRWSIPLFADRCMEKLEADLRMSWPSMGDGAASLAGAD
jgi:hypothetical protein